MNTAVPDGYKDCGFIMSNCYHTVDEGAEEKLVGKKAVGTYAGWNFCGHVWHEDSKFHCEVWRYGVPMGVLSADTLEELMEVVSDEWGYE